MIYRTLNINHSPPKNSFFNINIYNNLVSSNPIHASCTQWFSPGTLVSSTNITDQHDITEKLFIVAFHTITLGLVICTPKQHLEVKGD